MTEKEQAIIANVRRFLSHDQIEEMKADTRREVEGREAIEDFQRFLERYVEREIAAAPTIADELRDEWDEI